MSTGTQVGGTTIEIAPRFEGPPGLGNGGYVVGMLAARLGIDSIRCKLRRPIPTGRSLDLVSTPPAGGELRLDGVCLVIAEPFDLDFGCGEAPDFEAAERVVGRARAFESHPFPDCFVCGPQRVEDGLCILPGPADSAEHGQWMLAPWTPGASLAREAGGQGEIDPAFVFAALDCPTVFPLLEAPETRALEPMVLGRLSARVRELPTVGERCVVAAWAMGAEGRRASGRVAIWGEAGQLIGQAEGGWVSIAS